MKFNILKRNIPSSYRGLRRIAEKETDLAVRSCSTCKHAFVDGFSWRCERILEEKECKWEGCFVWTKLTWLDKVLTLDKWIKLPKCKNCGSTLVGINNMCRECGMIIKK